VEGLLSLIGELTGVLGLALFIGLFPIFVCIVIEQIAVIERYSLRARTRGLAMNAVLGVLSPSLVWPLQKLWHLIGIDKAVSVPLWTWLAPLGAAAFAVQVAILVVASDFLAYWRHRAEHKWFWPIHAVHHSPTELHAANDIGHPGQVWINMLCVSFPLSFIQFGPQQTPWAVSFVMTVLSIYIHSPIDVHFGPLRKLVVDNRYHRIHHSLEPKHFDKNFGICFSIWDRMFGTAYDPAPSEWPKVGLANLAPPRTISEFLSLPARVMMNNREAAPQPLATAAGLRGGSRSLDSAAATALASAPTVNGLRSSS